MNGRLADISTSPVLSIHPPLFWYKPSSLPLGSPLDSSQRGGHRTQAWPIRAFLDSCIFKREEPTACSRLTAGAKAPLRLAGPLTAMQGRQRTPAAVREKGRFPKEVSRTLGVSLRLFSDSELEPLTG